MTGLSFDLVLAHWLAATEITRRQQHGLPVPERLRTHLRALGVALASATGPADAATSAGSESTGPDRFITTAEAAAALGCSTRHVRRLGQRIGGHRIGHRWLFDTDAITEHRDGRNTECDTHPDADAR
ncbi:helix-turn-helix domain-containing protein [Nocardia altamirensis]|uniref:helix-turn-helix domain-containing protein n=1 Tax=Nocardia altamirensis TaxID=472158 RepID=UPI00084039A0|nr:helix-turn-helix domain-containing protein [Nocardia altamirensis]